MDLQTKSLVRRGLHPAQTSLRRYHTVPWECRNEVAYQEKLEAQQAADRVQAEQAVVDYFHPQPAEVEKTRVPVLRRITERIPLKPRTLIEADYPKYQAPRSEFEFTCVADYHTFLYDRYEFYTCEDPRCQLHLKLRRLQELNSRLKEDLERPRVKVAEASMSLINYCNQTRDYMVPSVWGQVDKKEDPYNPQAAGSEGCCAVM